MTVPPPLPTAALPSPAEVFLSYLDYFRSRVLDKVSNLPEADLRRSRLPSGWTPVELVKHLTYVELRWLEWGFQGVEVSEPWADSRAGRWYVAPDETREGLLAGLQARGERTRMVVEANELTTIGQPSERWAGAGPPPLERILFHLIQEYARHLGHLDAVVELAGGPAGQ